MCAIMLYEGHTVYQRRRKHGCRSGLLNFNSRQRQVKSKAESRVGSQFGHLRHAAHSALCPFAFHVPFNELHAKGIRGAAKDMQQAQNHKLRGPVVSFKRKGSDSVSKSQRSQDTEGCECWSLSCLAWRMLLLSISCPRERTQKRREAKRDQQFRGALRFCCWLAVGFPAAFLPRRWLKPNPRS